MGKTTFLTILGFALLAPLAAAKKPRLARVLPSQVKTITLVPNKHPKVSAPAASPLRIKAAKRIAEKGSRLDLSPELLAEADSDPWSSKFFARSVYYLRSNVRLGSEYDCDEEVLERKKLEAQSQAEERCLASGVGECRVAKTIIVKSGPLSCADFPGHKCPASGLFHGCVAESLVFGAGKGHLVSE